MQMKKRSVLNCPVEFDKNDFFSLVSLSVGYSIACQNAMGENIIGDNGWNVDIKGGKIKFGNKEFASGVLGSESYESDTWLWSWANTESGLPEIVSAPSRRAKKVLSQVPEFINGKFSLDELHTGHNLSMVCCAVSEENICYYRCPYSNGAAFVTVKGLPDEIFAPLSAESFVRECMDIIGGFYCDHLLMVAGFLYQSGYDFEQNGAVLSADVGGTCLFFEFEYSGDMYRLMNISC